MDRGFQHTLVMKKEILYDVILLKIYVVNFIIFVIFAGLTLWKKNVFVLYLIKYIKYREGHGAMVRAWRSADVAACRAVSNPAWCRIFREISCFSSLNLGHF